MSTRFFQSGNVSHRMEVCNRLRMDENRPEYKNVRWIRGRQNFRDGLTVLNLGNLVLGQVHLIAKKLVDRRRPAQA